MPNYQKMYCVLFQEVTRVIEQLKTVQRETEELYIASGEAPVTLIPQETDLDAEQDGTYKGQPHR